MGATCQEMAAGILRRMDEGAGSEELRRMLSQMSGEEPDHTNGKEAQKRLEKAATRTGAAIAARLGPDSREARKIEDILQIPFSPESASIAALVIIHAIARTSGGMVKTRAGLLRRWEKAGLPGSRERFVPITLMASGLLRAIGEDHEREPTRTMVEAAESLQDPSMVGDLMQRLVPDRKLLGTYHTRQASATLMARLAVPDDRDWADPEEGRCRIADYSCGTGRLLRAAALRVREINAAAGRDAAVTHRPMMEEDITAIDILPASVAVAVTELDALEREPGELPESTGGMTMRHGPIDRASPAWKDRPRHAGLGALDLIRSKTAARQPLEPIARTAPAQGGPDLRPRSQDLVIMNPPFSRENEAPMPPVGSSRQASPGEMQSTRDRMRETRAITEGSTNSGLGSQFAMLATRMVKPGGTIALLLPETALAGGGNKKLGWPAFRRLLAREYRDVRVLGITAYTEQDSAFSLDTTIAEVMVIAQRRRRGEWNRLSASFVSVNRQPRDDGDAASMADAILDIIWEVNEAGNGTIKEITQGDLKVRAIRATMPTDGSPWRDARVDQHEINRDLNEIRRHRRAGGAQGGIPVATMGEIALVGPDAAILGGWKNKPRDLNQGDGIQVPALITHECNAQRAIETEPNGFTRMDPKGRLRMSRLHINNNFRYNSQSTAACMTRVPSAGSKHWPTVGLDDEAAQKVIAIWMNSTLGLMFHWNAANRTQHGLGYLNSWTLKNTVILDPRKLAPCQMDEFEELFEGTKANHLMAANEAWRDDNRMELDRRMMKILGLSPEIQQNVAHSRNRWCQEPTVIGRKGDHMDRQADIEQLRRLITMG